MRTQLNHALCIGIRPQHFLTDMLNMLLIPWKRQSLVALCWTITGSYYYSCCYCLYWMCAEYVVTFITMKATVSSHYAEASLAVISSRGTFSPNNGAAVIGRVQIVWYYHCCMKENDTICYWKYCGELGESPQSVILGYLFVWYAIEIISWVCFQGVYVHVYNDSDNGWIARFVITY